MLSTSKQYPDGVSEPTVAGQTARAVVEYRYTRFLTAGSTPWSHHGSLDSNCAAVTLVFKDGSLITKPAPSAGAVNSDIPYSHSEFRALGNAISEAIETGKEGFTTLTKKKGNSGYDEYKTLFAGWRPALNTLDQIVVYSDRSPCNLASSNCERFFQQLAEHIKPATIQIFYDMQYKQGGSTLQLSADLTNAQPIVKNRIEAYTTISNMFIETSEKIRKSCENAEGDVASLKQVMEKAQEDYKMAVQEFQKTVANNFSIKEKTLGNIEIKLKESEECSILTQTHEKEFKKAISKIEAKISAANAPATAEGTFTTDSTEKSLADRLSGVKGNYDRLQQTGNPSEDDDDVNVGFLHHKDQDTSKKRKTALPSTALKTILSEKMDDEEQVDKIIEKLKEKDLKDIKISKNNSPSGYSIEVQCYESDAEIVTATLKTKIHLTK